MRRALLLAVTVLWFSGVGCDGPSAESPSHQAGSSQNGELVECAAGTEQGRRTAAGLEIQGEVAGAGQLWGLVQSDRVESAQPIKIVWKMTGDAALTLRATLDGGESIEPVWGPELHQASSWNRPGDEWGSGFRFPTPGCWRIVASRGEEHGQIALRVD